ncbi:hypothetical protein HPB49_008183 [Dermacentor silvarum]|uniref:Uncharacterized protein n=1 Tax=Dermacentor silvarum TaxID=543639 RepID=A0ACB8C893_DERSI|nr:hypothetical protein HPB49_008183 [Dermacentor silvarum]
MFTGTLRENLDPQGCHSDEVLRRVLRSAHLDDFFERTPEGLLFAVSQTGENLSAGQRQLMVLARALLRATRILVLDKATSQMDTDTERRVPTSLRKSLAHCTIITIAHRIGTILDYDRLAMCDRGSAVFQDLLDALLRDAYSLATIDTPCHIRMRAIVYPVTGGSTAVAGWDSSLIFSNNCAFTVVVYVAGTLRPTKVMSLSRRLRGYDASTHFFVEFYVAPAACGSVASIECQAATQPASETQSYAHRVSKNAQQDASVGDESHH